jgi:hypothetical protein
MGARVAVLATVLLCAGVNAASATFLIADDRGGRIGAYMQTFSSLRSSGEAVVIDGLCLSACTLIVGILPTRQVCVTPRARLGFHAAWQPDNHGRRIRSELGTQALMEVYPPKVRSWIRRRGGLSKRMIYLQGRELSTIYPRCRAAR